MQAKNIFSWDTVDAYRFPERKARAQFVDGVQMQMLRAEIEPGGIYPMHSHPHEQFSLLVSGRLRLTVGDETRDIGPGDSWDAPSNVEHGGEILGDEKVVFFDVYAPKSEWFAQWIANHPNSKET